MNAFEEQRRVSQSNISCRVIANTVIQILCIVLYILEHDFGQMTEKKERQHSYCKLVENII